MTGTEPAVELERPGNLAWLVSRQRAVLGWVLLVLSGAGYAAAFPPLDWGWLGWLGIAPLYGLVAWLAPRPWAAWRAGWWWGLAWALAAFSWLREIEWFVPFLLAPVLALFPACWAAAIPLVRRGLLLPVAVQLEGTSAMAEYRPSPLRETLVVAVLAAWWVVLDWVRGWVGTGLPWNYPAATQWRNLPLLQLAEYTGAHGITFLLVFANLAVALAVRDAFHGARRGLLRRPLPALAALALLMLAVTIGGMSLMRGRHYQGEYYFSAGVIQADIPQCRAASEEETAQALAKHLRLSRALVAEHARNEDRIIGGLMLSGEEVEVPPEQLARIGPLGVIIWPETAVPVPYVPGYFAERYPLIREYAKAMFNLTAETRTRYLIGSLQYDAPEGGGPDAVRAYNSALLLDLDATILGRYDKIQIVPFGEYVPYGRHAGWLKRQFGMGRDLSRGTRFNPLELREGVRAGVNICYEDVFPRISRRLVQNGANLLVTLTNDAWYPRSSEPVQHLANAVLRAVETRRPLLRCGNNVASCLILPSGVIADALHRRAGPAGRMVPDPTRRGEGTGVFVVPLHARPALTFYTRYGDLFVLACGVSVMFAGLAGLWTWRERHAAVMRAWNEPAGATAGVSAEAGDSDRDQVRQ